MPRAVSSRPSLDPEERRRLREAMVARIRAGKPNPFESSSPAHVAFAFTEELLRHADRAPDSPLGRQAREALGLGDGRKSPGIARRPMPSRTTLREGLDSPLEDMEPSPVPPLPTTEPPKLPPLPEGKPPVPVGHIDPVSRDFADAIAQRESLGSGGYRAVNPDGPALGRYQMRRIALQSVGFKDPEGRWTGALGVGNEGEFLNNPAAQDIAFAGYMRVLREELERRRVLDRIGVRLTAQDGRSITVTNAGLIAAGHREGSYAVKAYLDFAGSKGWSTYGTAFPTGNVPGTRRLLADSFAQIEDRLADFENIGYLSAGAERPPLVVPAISRHK